MKQVKKIRKSDRVMTHKGKSQITNICKKAARVFSAKGYSSASLVDISHAAGLSKGGIYHYFSTKEELLFVILDNFMVMLLDGLEKELETISSPEEKIRYFIRRHIKYYCDNVYSSRVVLHETNNLPARYWTVIREKTKKYTFILGNVVKEFLDDENVSSEKVRVLTYTLLGMCNWIYWWYNPKGSMKPEELTDVISNTFFGTIKDK